MNQQAYAEFKVKREEVLCQLKTLEGLMQVETFIDAPEVHYGHVRDLGHVQEILGEAIAFLRNQDESDEEPPSYPEWNGQDGIFHYEKL